MRIGIACPYSWDVPGGVQFHIRDLAVELQKRGHVVSVVAPATEGTEVPDFVSATGAAIPIPYNGSVARLAFGPRVNKHVKTWLEEGHFDVVHVHEPFVPSIAMLALMNADVPVVSTFHTAIDRSRFLAIASPMLIPMLEKIRARIAVSQEARRTAVEHLGGDAYIIPNGVDTSVFREAPRDDRFTGTPSAPTVAFLGRIDEPRKGLPILARAIKKVRESFPGLRVFVAGRGETAEAEKIIGSDNDCVTFLGSVSEDDKARLLSSVDLYIAPQTGGESFGIVLVEAMSAGSFVISSDIPAFRAVLGHGEFGAHFRSEDSDDLARVMIESLSDPEMRRAKIEAAGDAALRYDWGQVATDVLDVYQFAVAANNVPVRGWRP